MGNSVLDWLFDNVMPWIMNLAIVAIVLLIAAAPFAIYAEYKAEKFYLRKDEWACTASVERPITTYVQSGNVMVPITTYSKHCTQWSERP